MTKIKLSGHVLTLFCSWIVVSLEIYMFVPLQRHFCTAALNCPVILILIRSRTFSLVKWLSRPLFKSNVWRVFSSSWIQSQSEDFQIGLSNNVQMTSSTLPIFKDWEISFYIFNFQHPYPSEDQKKQLAQDTGLTILQVNNWWVIHT